MPELAIGSVLLDRDGLRFKVVSIRKFNPYHAPAGSSVGGQFTSGDAPPDGPTTPEEYEKVFKASVAPPAKYQDSYSGGRESLEEPDRWAPLNFDESISLGDYSTRGYSKINKWLRAEAVGKALPNLKDRLFDPEKIKTNLDAIFKRTSLSQDMTVYRSVSSGLANKVSKAKDGAMFHDAGFISTTTDRNYVEQFAQRKKSQVANKVVRVALPKGSKAFPAKNFQEKEILLNRGSKFVKQSDAKGAYLRLVK